jgi:hypothetical protein
MTVVPAYPLGEARGFLVRLCSSPLMDAACGPARALLPRGFLGTAGLAWACPSLRVGPDFSEARGETRTQGPISLEKLYMYANEKSQKYG